VNFAANSIYNKDIGDNKQTQNIFVQIRERAVKCLDT
jgi:hypothetical protein